jgi:hypothetical protein
MKNPLRKPPRQLLDPAEFVIEPISDDPTYRAAAALVAQLKARLAETTKRRERALAYARSQAPTAIRTGAADAQKETRRRSRVAALLSGGSVQAIDPQRELEAAQREEDDLLAELYEANKHLADVVAELSYQMAQRYREQHAESLRAAWEAIVALHSAVDCMHSLRARLLASGFYVNSLHPAMPPVQLGFFGDPQRFGTEANRYRQWLEKLGVL